MSEYKFTYEDTEYILNANNCSELINDEEKPVKKVVKKKVVKKKDAPSSEDDE